MATESPGTSTKRSDSSRAGAGCALGVVLALVLGGAMVVLVVVLTRGHDAGRKALDTYVASIRSGAAVSPSVAGMESAAVAEVLRATSSLSVSNFQSQSDTSCFWVTLRSGGREVEARFVLAERASAPEVTAVSLSRDCECPIDFEEPCGLR